MGWEWRQNISKEIFDTKYKLHGEKDIDEVFSLVAREISSSEKGKNKKKYEEQFYDVMSKGLFCPAGRVLANARPNGKIKNYNNCFVIDIQDSMESITDAIKEYMTILQHGGGVGINISHLRPKGAAISKGGASSGVMSFLEIFNTASETIKVGGGRRGASICILNVDHPDIEEFITYKQGDKNGKLKNFNISVGITDKFMQAYKEDKDWNLIFNGKIYKTVKAKYLYELLTKNAMEYAEPGIFFLDTANKYNNLYNEFTIESTNPCFSSDTLITTKQGIYPIIDLVGKKIDIFDGNKWKEIDNFRKTGENKEIYRVTLNSGIYFDVTDYHEFILKDGTRKKTIELIKGDNLEFNNKIETYGNISEKGAYVKGFLLGDGFLKRNKKDPLKDRAVLFLYKPKFICKNRIKESLEELPIINSYKNMTVEDIHFNEYDIIGSNLKRISVSGIVARDKDLYKYAGEYKKTFPLNIFNYDEESKLKFIAGLMDADGTSLNSHKRFGFQFSCKHKEFIINFLRLLNSVGIYGKISQDTRKRKITSYNNKTYYFNTTYRITIPQSYAIKLSKKVDTIGGFSRIKSHADKNISYKVKFKYNKVNSVESLNKYEDVYCCTIKNEHKFLINGGIIIGQCGEQPLEAYSDNKGNKFYGSCNLGSINLSKMVTNPFSEKAEVDWKNLKYAIETGVRFLDDVIDAMEAPLKYIGNEMKRIRRIGLGFMGWGDMLAMMRIPYNSEDAIEFANIIGKFFRDVAYDYSIDLAKEKGSFPILNKQEYLNGNFIKQLPNDIKNKIKKYGIRNSFLLSCAPSGTISFSVGNNCSSGIEPIFSLRYDRKIRIGGTNDTKTETVYDYGYLKYLDIVSDVNDIPDYFVTAHDVLPKQKIDMISMWQKYIDTAISNTTNIKKDFSYDDFKDLYAYAFESGLKGFTTFWEGGQLKGILSTEKENTDTIIRKNAPKRPSELNCDIYEISSDKEKYIILVGKMDDGSLYEIFVTKNSDNKLDMEKHKTGKIVKINKGQYNLVVNHEGVKTIIEDIGNTFDGMLGTLARLVSMSLRHGTPLQFIIQQLAKDKNFLGFERVVSRVLKKYIKDGEHVVTSDLCPECQNKLIYIDGCMSCQNCGWSKCG